MSNTILKKENGVVTSLEPTAELLKAIEEGKKCHLCWTTCGKAYANQCPKIADEFKKSIDSYDFITDGIQVIDEKGEVDTFIVEKCNSCEKSKKPIITGRKAKELRDALRTAYFGTATTDEAFVLQDELVKRGLLLEVKGKVKTDEEISKIKKRMGK